MVDNKENGEKRLKLIKINESIKEYQDNISYNKIIGFLALLNVALAAFITFANEKHYGETSMLIIINTAIVVVKLLSTKSLSKKKKELGIEANNIEEELSK